MGYVLTTQKTKSEPESGSKKAASQRKSSYADSLTRIPLWASYAYGNAVLPSLHLTEKPLQGKTEAISTPSTPSTTSTAPNKTGLPTALKTGIETLSGLSMDDVAVHYHSSQPAQVRALAYTQGTDIHLRSGQEQHLAHEAWHVVQQKQGRVQPTARLRGAAINDDTALEHEADVMGARARTHAVTPLEDNAPTTPSSSLQSSAPSSRVLQAVWEKFSATIWYWQPLIDGVTWFTNGQMFWFFIGNSAQITGNAAAYAYWEGRHYTSNQWVYNQQHFPQLQPPPLPVQAPPQPQQVQQPAVVQQPVVIQQPPVVQQPVVVQQPIVAQQPVVVQQPFLVPQPVVTQQPFLVPQLVVIQQPADPISIIKRTDLTKLKPIALGNSRAKKVFLFDASGQPTESKAKAVFLVDTGMDKTEYDNYLKVAKWGVRVPHIFDVTREGYPILQWLSKQTTVGGAGAKPLIPSVNQRMKLDEINGKPFDKDKWQRTLQDVNSLIALNYTSQDLQFMIEDQSGDVYIMDLEANNAPSLIDRPDPRLLALKDFLKACLKAGKRVELSGSSSSNLSKLVID